MFLAAAIQLTSTSDSSHNLAMASTLIRRAAEYGASFIATPENTNFLGPHADKVRLSESITDSTIGRFQELARKYRIHLLMGSFNERSDDVNRCYNTSVLCGPDGDILGTYRKIHLFDVDISSEVRFMESDTVKPGSTPTVIHTPLGAIGLSICYDLRFPELYRQLLDNGAEILMIPAAFTATTGKDHWHPLLQARAIETQCWVMAPGQSGRHDDNGLRQSYGHSLIIDPWGTIVANAVDGPGIALAEINLDRMREIRRAMPISQHRRIR